MSKLAFVITAYNDVCSTENNIKRIRQEYKKFNNSDIIVVTTAEINVGFKELEDCYENVHVIEFFDAPGNAACDWWVSPPCYPAELERGYISWRHEFLPPRIILSVEKGLRLAHQLGNRYALHLHSDTYWLPTHEFELARQLTFMEHYGLMLITDISKDEEDSVRGQCLLPEGLHIHPEGTIIALPSGFCDFHRVYDEKSGFKSHCYGSSEALWGQFAIWCVTGKNILSWKDHIPQDYYKRVLLRTSRTYHGVFPFGLVNVR